MFNRTIAELEAISSSTLFERLCSTLLLPEYPNLIPVGGSGDRGRDAKATVWLATDTSSRNVVLQYSYQKTWEAKLKKELGKVKAREDELKPHRYVFVTNCRVSDDKRKELEKLVRTNCGWELEIFDQEWLRARLESPAYLHLRRDYLKLLPDTIPLFLPLDDFLARQRRSTLILLDLPLVGRDDELAVLYAWLKGSAPIMLVHGVGGTGKTRLLVALAEHVAVEEGWEPIFVRSDAEQFEPHLEELTSGQPYLVIVDDAHRFEHLGRLGELLTNKGLGPTKILLVTRPVFRDAVTSFAAGRYGIEELGLGQLGRAELDQMISAPPFDLADPRVRNAVLDVANGNALIAQSAARVVRSGQALVGLGRDAVLQRYFDRVITESLGQDLERGRDYLAVVAGIGGLDVDNVGLREQVRNTVGISEADERRLVARMENAGVLSVGHRRMRVVPDVLADHLLARTFFAPMAHQRDFADVVLKPYFRFAGPAIIRNLAESEFRDGSEEAAALLTQVLVELSEQVSAADNVGQYRILEHVANVGALRPEDVVTIVTRVVDTKMGPDGAHRCDGPITDFNVLTRAIDILAQTAVGAISDSIACLHALTRYGGADRYGWYVRKRAVETLEALFSLKPNHPVASYNRTLEAICWGRNCFLMKRSESAGLIAEAHQPGMSGCWGCDSARV